MSTVQTCLLGELASKMPADLDHLIVSASYEERAHGVWEQIQASIRGKKFVCFNANHEVYLKQSLGRFRTNGSGAECVALNSDEPHATFEAIRHVIESLREIGICHLAVDLTGFTREAMAMLLYLAKYRLAPGSRLTAFYQKASRYGRTPQKGWLSQGVREVRSILGYAGQMRLSANTHLLLLSGFESERAQEIIDTIEPSRLSLGTISVTNPISEDKNPHNEALREFTCRVKSFYASTRLDEFEFSSSEPLFTRDCILRLAKASARNVVLSCLNSKPAMVGACLAAIEYPMIQLIYAQPLYYNTKSYSEPSGNVLFFEVPL